MSDTTTGSGESAVRPFRIEVPQDELDELRRRINATRWPTRELVTDRSQGVQLAAIQNLVRYWATEYDWRRCEARLNALPQFKTEIDGLNIHFIHVESAHKDALPLIMTHGWPGSVVPRMSVNDNKELVRRYFDGRWNDKELRGSRRAT